MRKAFSLMELMVVVVVVGVVAGFGIPNYQRSLNISIAKDAVSNLKLIAAAQQLYFARNGNYYPSPTATENINNINDTLHLNILEQQGVTYTCTYSAPQCSATRGSWTYSISLPTTLPVCTAGSCPYTPTY
jgi:prepilin-type N-terminal cleavage/methylation domain-containing protein